MAKQKEPLRMPKLRELTKREMKWAEKQLPAHTFLWYKRDKNRATITCSYCGGTSEGYIGTAKAGSERIMKYVDTPAHRTKGQCALCHAVGVYVSIGRAKKNNTVSLRWVTGQRHGEDGYVFRAYETEAVSIPNNCTAIAHQEYARVFLQKGKKPQKWYYYYTWGEGAWHPHNIGGVSNISVQRDVYHPDWKKELDKTWMRYAKRRYYDPLSYYEMLSWHPDLEMIGKLGMKDLERQIIQGYAVGWNPRGKKPADRLRIRGDRMKDLREHGNVTYLRIYQSERKSGRRWTDREIAAELYLGNFWDRRDRETLREVFKHTTPEKLEDYLRYVAEAPRNLYLDYIRMRIAEGYDLSNGIYLFPRDLRREHNELVRQRETAQLDARIREAQKKYVGIEHRYGKLSKFYGWESGDYTIRPAKDAEEIIMEGRLQHHCVGGDNYLSKHSKGESFILLMRRKGSEEPYVTIEIRGEKILQWYEAYDRKDHEDTIEPWLDDYLKHLKEEKHGRARDKV